jgi:hypothetical protein
LDGKVSKDCLKSTILVSSLLTAFSFSVLIWFYFTLRLRQDSF